MPRIHHHPYMPMFAPQASPQPFAKTHAGPTRARGRGAAIDAMGLAVGRGATPGQQASFLQAYAGREPEVAPQKLTQFVFFMRTCAGESPAHVAAALQLDPQFIPYFSVRLAMHGPDALWRYFSQAIGQDAPLYGHHALAPAETTHSAMGHASHLPAAPGQIPPFGAAEVSWQPSLPAHLSQAPQSAFAMPWGFAEPERFAQPFDASQPVGGYPVGQPHGPVAMWHEPALLTPLVPAPEPFAWGLFDAAAAAGWFAPPASISGIVPPLRTPPVVPTQHVPDPPVFSHDEGIQSAVERRLKLEAQSRERRQARRAVNPDDIAQKREPPLSTTQHPTLAQMAYFAAYFDAHAARVPAGTLSELRVTKLLCEGVPRDAARASVVRPEGVNPARVLARIARFGPIRTFDRAVLRCLNRNPARQRKGRTLQDYPFAAGHAPDAPALTAAQAETESLAPWPGQNGVDVFVFDWGLSEPIELLPLWDEVMR